jgi:hypothetical protein
MNHEGHKGHEEEMSREARTETFVSVVPFVVNLL